MRDEHVRNTDLKGHRLYILKIQLTKHYVVKNVLLNVPTLHTVILYKKKLVLNLSRMQRSPFETKKLL